MKLSVLERVIDDQKNMLELSETGLERELLTELSARTSHALIVTGIRRCGKSTVLHQYVKKNQQTVFYLNFDDLRLYDFELSDFALLDEMISKSEYATLFFDEIQVVEGWELYVRQKLDQHYQVVLTGSNATLLSQELGTKLTGRHVNKELFPFSYREFLQFEHLQFDSESMEQYLRLGGFPEYLKSKEKDVLTALIEDIIHRDIAVRYGVRDVSSLKRLCSYLFSNVGNLVSPSKLKSTIGVKSASTILEYFSHLESCYLVHLMPKFSYSYKAQMLAPKKIYVIDSALIHVGSVSFSENNGHLLENLMFWEFRRKSFTLNYFSENGYECDFVLSRQGKVEQLIQVCFDLNSDNQNREVNGLFEAMKSFGMDSGTIVTMHQHDKILKEGKTIVVLPATEFLH